MKRSLLSLIALAAAVSAATGAAAHAQLKSAAPAPKSVVRTPPQEVSIGFSEKLEPRFSAIAVTDAAGARVDRDDLHVTGEDGRRLAVTLGPLAPGTYTVTWRATATDTHKSDGVYVFTLAP